MIGGDICPEKQGMGYGQCMFRACQYYAFNVLNCHRIYLYTLETNNRAIHIYKKLGMLEEGRMKDSIYRNGKYIDMICMYMLKSDYQKFERINYA